MVAAPRRAHNRGVTRILLLPMSTMLSELLTRPLAQAPGIELHVAAGDDGAIRRKLTAFAPDWAIAELGDDGIPGEWADLFALSPQL
jgi:hypothetical protein